MSSKLIILCQASTSGPKKCYGIHQNLLNKTISYGDVLSVRLTFTNRRWLQMFPCDSNSIY